MDQVDLTFSPDALDATTRKALDRETGARGLRAIIEGALLDVMYEIPSRPEIRGVMVDRDVIEGIAGPRLLDGDGRPLGGRGEKTFPRLPSSPRASARAPVTTFSIAAFGPAATWVWRWLKFLPWKRSSLGRGRLRRRRHHAPARPSGPGAANRLRQVRRRCPCKPSSPTPERAAGGGSGAGQRPSPEAATPGPGKGQ
jgi:hypothetical protein